MGFEDELIGRVHKVMGADQPLPGMELTAAPVQFTSDFGMEEFFGIPKSQVPDLAAKYITWVETSPTTETCKCEWAMHPDDVDLPGDVCRVCRAPKHDGMHVPDDQLYSHDFRPRRLRLKEEHPLCPVHSKVGRIAGFFEWLFLVHKEDADASGRG